MRTRSLQSSRADKGDAARMARIAGVRDTWRSSPTVGRGMGSVRAQGKTGRTVVILTGL